MIDQASAVAAVADPGTTAQVLAEITQGYPELRPAVARHPNVYPELSEWLALYGGQPPADTLRHDEAAAEASAAKRAVVEADPPLDTDATAQAVVPPAASRAYPASSSSSQSYRAGTAPFVSPSPETGYPSIRPGVSPPPTVVSHPQQPAMSQPQPAMSQPQPAPYAQPSAYPQQHAVSQPQPVASPQPQPLAYPQPPVAYPQQQPVAYPQPQPPYPQQAAGFREPDGLVATGGYGAAMPSAYGPAAYGQTPMPGPNPANYAAYQGYPGYQPQPGYPQPGYPYLMVPPGKSGVMRMFDQLTGFEGQAIVRFRDLFRDTFKKHSGEDMTALMYAGTPAAMYDHKWRLPWLYARVGAVLLGACLVLLVTVVVFKGIATIPGVMFTGAMVLPATIMIFLWEFDQARNISFFNVVTMFMIGAALSLLVTFIIGAGFDQFGLEAGANGVYAVGPGFFKAILVGVSEEVAKAAAVFVLVRKLYGCLISNGLVVGATVGAGFAAFETMGYALINLIRKGGGVNEMTFNLLLRGVLSPGGHVAWAAVAGAALMMAQRPGAQQVTFASTNWAKFLPLFSVPIVLHAAWDFFSFIGAPQQIVYGVMGGCIVMIWIFLVRLINTGLRQYSTLSGAGV